MTAGPDPLMGRRRAGSWLPAWRVIGRIFVAYPVIRIIAAPPEPIVAVLVLSTTAIFALLIGPSVQWAFKLFKVRAQKPETEIVEAATD